jgi:hypothetical protein
VTPEECLLGLRRADKMMYDVSPFVMHDSFGVNGRQRTDEEWTAVTLNAYTNGNAGGGMDACLQFLMTSNLSPMSRLAFKFYFRSHQDRVDSTLALRNSRHPADPILHWQTIDQAPVFGAAVLLPCRTAGKGRSKGETGAVPLRGACAQSV